MNHPSHYATVSEAINKLGLQGYTTDFNLEENALDINGREFEAGDLEIVDVYRYEGETDPSDEATVYAIESKSGLKGILVTGYGMTTETRISKLLEQLKFRE
jgi:hypothetical protein